MGESNSKVKVVINYADHVKQQMTSTDYQQAANSSENDNQSQSNISIGYNHAPSSDRHHSSTNLEPKNSEGPEWPIFGAENSN